MEQFKNQLKEGIKSLLEIYDPYRDRLSEDQLKDVAVLESVHDILCSDNIPNSVCQ